MAQKKIKNPKFTERELEFIKARIEIELDWGPGIYDESQMKIMNSIMSKIKKAINHEG